MAKKPLFAVLLITIGLMLFQNCAGGAGEDSDPVGGGDDVSKKDTDLDLKTDSPFQININDPEPTVTLPNNDMDTDGEGNTNALGPDVLANTDVVVRAPNNCENECRQANDCSSKTGTQKTMCERGCDRDNGICQDTTVSRDPNTLQNITIPAGYKRARLEIEFCSDRNDMMIFGGPSVAFKTTHKTRRNPYWFWWWNDDGNGWWDWWGWRTHVVGQEVGRGNWCMYRSRRGGEAFYWWWNRNRTGPYKDTAYVKVKQSTNAQGQSLPEREYRWAMPGFLAFNFGKVVSDMDKGKAAYAIVRSIEGRGIKRFAYYNNQSDIGQVETVLEFDVPYYPWWNHVYTVKVDFYYKKALSISQQISNSESVNINP